MVKALATLASEKHYAGYVFDFENLTPDTITALPAFVAAVHDAFAPQHLKLWLTVPADGAGWPMAALQQAVGFAPNTPVAVGIKQFVDWYRNHMISRLTA